MNHRCPSTFPLALATLLLAAGAAAQNTVDEHGRLQRLQLGKGWIHLDAEVRIPLKGWTGALSFPAVKPAAELGPGGRRTWKATLSSPAPAPPAAPGVAKEGVEIEVTQSVQEIDGKLVYDIQALSKSDGEIEGVLFWLNLPAEPFAGGAFQSGGLRGVLPRELPAEYHLSSLLSPGFSFFDAAGKAEVAAQLDPPVQVAIQDGRKWSPHFSALVYVHSGNLARGTRAACKITLSAKGDVEDTPANLALEVAPKKRGRYRVAGIGGNYCFNIESPVTRYTLDNLKVAFARTEMSLPEWEPENDNDDPAKIDWPKLVARDEPGKRLRLEFELMRELARKKIPFASSVWRLPGWTYTRPPADRNRNLIADGKWPEVLECIGSYLLYAKEKYQAEPDWFSFNEPEIGVRVLFTAEEHREAILRIGAHLKKLGLKTTMLLGDVANPGSNGFIEPASRDPEAMKFVTALAFHTWGGAKPDIYAHWAETAERLKLPLLVAEAGPDPGAWQGSRYQSFDYGMREVAHYQELFLHARPQAVAFWEFTGDYSLLATDKQTRKLKLTERFCFQKHWSDFILPGSEALQTSSDNEAILFTAFRNQPNESAGGDAHPTFTLHIANTKWARRVTLTGIPAVAWAGRGAPQTWNAVRTSRGELFKRMEPLIAQDGKLTLDLPAQSLTTLTTLAIEELKEP